MTFEELSPIQQANIYQREFQALQNVFQYLHIPKTDTEIQTEVKTRLQYAKFGISPEREVYIICKRHP